MLEQTIRRRLPELEASLKAAKQAMAELDAANAELRNAANSQADALKLARTTVNSQRGDIDQLRGALGTEAASSRRSAKSNSELAKENRRLSAELSKLKEELTQGKVGGKENDLLRRELGTLAKQILAVAKAQGTALPEPARLEARPFVEDRARAAPSERAPALIARREDALIGDTSRGPRERDGADRISPPRPREPKTLLWPKPKDGPRRKARLPKFSPPARQDGVAAEAKAAAKDKA